MGMSETLANDPQVQTMLASLETEGQREQLSELLTIVEDMGLVMGSGGANPPTRLQLDERVLVTFLNYLGGKFDATADFAGVPQDRRHILALISGMCFGAALVETRQSPRA